jgi:2,3-bisphosphoglycerate-independent phosphoglycerate mutase
MLITADHGNIEIMRDPETGGQHTQHTIGPVPVLLVSQQSDRVALRDGSLSDLAPTVLALMGLAQPKQMTGGSLLSPLGQMARQG